MPDADANDIEFARRLIIDSVLALRWAASDAGVDNEQNPVVSPNLKPFMAGAVEEVHDGAFQQALRILNGDDPDFPPENVSAALDSVGWTGASRIFKEQALNEAGREEVMAAVDGHGPNPRRMVWRKFLKVLNVALGSLSVIPGVEPIKELKDFAEATSSD
jgi:hypothetical protein